MESSTDKEKLVEKLSPEQRARLERINQMRRLSLFCKVTRGAADFKVVDVIMFFEGIHKFCTERQFMFKILFDPLDSTWTAQVMEEEGESPGMFVSTSPIDAVCQAILSGEVLHTKKEK